MHIIVDVPKFRNHSALNISSLGLLHYAATDRKGMSNGTNLLTTHALDLLLYLQGISYLVQSKSSNVIVRSRRPMYIIILQQTSRGIISSSNVIDCPCICLILFRVTFGLTTYGDLITALGQNP